MFIFPSSKPTNARDWWLQRIFEIMPGFFVWAVLIGCSVLAFTNPVWIAVFIIVFDLYWLLKIFYVYTHLLASYRKKGQWEKINWLDCCKKLSTSEITETVSPQNKIKDWRQLYHLIILPTYKEGLEILEPSIQSLIESNWPKEKMIVILAIEKRAGAEACEKAKILEEKFGSKFFLYLTTCHPANIPGEAKVKGANVSWAAKEAKKVIDEKGIDYENVIVSSFDCDSRPHQEYFACLAWHWAQAGDRNRLSYQPLPMYNNNIWQTNAFARVIATGSSFWNMIQCSRPEQLITFSSHSMSFKALVEVGYWPPDLLADDSIIFWKCLMHYGGDYKVKPIFLPISMDAVLGETYWKTLVAQYKQHQRWGYCAAENMPLIIRGFMQDKKIPLRTKLRRVFQELEGRFSWATAPIIIAFLGWFPLYFGGEEFMGTVLSLSFPNVLRFLINLAMGGLIFSMLLSIVLLPPRPKEKGKHYYLIMIFQWLLIPFTTIPFGAMPAIDAQTRLMLGKHMEFWVTKKVKK